MYSIRDLLVCGPVIFVTVMFHQGGWVLPLTLGVLLYGAMRFLADLIGLEQTVRDRRQSRNAKLVAQRAERVADARSRAGRERRRALR